MPRVSSFHGIGIYMYYSDHAPPHFHAIYERDEAEIDIATLTVNAGRLPRRALRLVREWARSYKKELQASWLRARAGRPLMPIPPPK